MPTMAPWPGGPDNLPKLSGSRSDERLGAAWGDSVRCTQAAARTDASCGCAARTTRQVVRATRRTLPYCGRASSERRRRVGRSLSIPSVRTPAIDGGSNCGTDLHPQRTVVLNILVFLFLFSLLAERGVEMAIQISRMNLLPGSIERSPRARPRHKCCQPHARYAAHNLCEFS
jgi:hypothetical protein